MERDLAKALKGAATKGEHKKLFCEKCGTTVSVTDAVKRSETGYRSPAREDRERSETLEKGSVSRKNSAQGSRRGSAKNSIKNASYARPLVSDEPKRRIVGGINRSIRQRTPRDSLSSAHSQNSRQSRQSNNSKRSQGSKLSRSAK